jgi:hypothetical protein
MEREHFTHAVTLNPNRGTISVRFLEKLFKRFCHEMDREKLRTSRPYRAPASERFEAIAMPEHLESNPHLHLVADLNFLIDRTLTLPSISFLIERTWKRVTMGSGTVDVQILGEGCREKYIANEFDSADHSYFLASDFHTL